MKLARCSKNGASILVNNSEGDPVWGLWIKFDAAMWSDLSHKFFNSIPLCAKLLFVFHRSYHFLSRLFSEHTKTCVQRKLRLSLLHWICDCSPRLEKQLILSQRLLLYPVLRNRPCPESRERP